MKKIGKTFELNTYEDEKAFYVKVTNKEYKKLADKDQGLYNQIIDLEVYESTSEYDILIWSKK